MADEAGAVILPENLDKQVRASTDGLVWEASEYVHHHKPANWYVGFFILGMAICGALYLLLHDIFAVIVVGLMFIALFVYAVRKPETLQYGVSDHGLTIGAKHYDYARFRSFSVISGGGVPSIAFEPLQRFSPPISIFCEPNQLDKVVELLAKYLPQADRQPDFIDRLSQSLRF